VTHRSPRTSIDCLGGKTIQLVNTDPPYNVKVEPRSNNAIAAGLSSFSNDSASQKLKGGQGNAASFGVDHETGQTQAPSNAQEAPSEGSSLGQRLCDATKSSIDCSMRGLETSLGCSIQVAVSTSGVGTPTAATTHRSSRSMVCISAKRSFGTRCIRC
jgi:hypothetical protein